MKPQKISTLYRPWGGGWQRWTFESRAAGWNLAGSEAPSADAARGVLVALPARCVLALPIWVETTESQVLREMVELQLEMLGVAAGPRLETDVRIQPLADSGNKTLVRTLVYPPNLPADTPLPASALFEPAPLLAELEDETLHLWEESGRLVAVLVTDGKTVCWEAADRDLERRELLAWLNCLLLQLRGDEIIKSDLALKDWSGRLAGQAPFGCSHRPATPQEQERGPKPAMPAAPSAWLAPEGRAMREQSRVRSRFAAAAALVLAMALVVISVAAGYQWFLGAQMREVRREAAALSGTAQPLQQIARKWRRLEAATETRFFPLEVLHQVVSRMPSDGVRLTTVDLVRDRIHVEGEASNVGAATRFFNNLKEVPADIRWEMPPPSLLPNNTARFIISGTRSDAPDQ